MTKEYLSATFPELSKYLEKGQLQYDYDYKDEVSYLNALPDHNKFATVRGIRIGDSQSKVFEKYGQETFNSDHYGAASAYALHKQGEIIKFIKDSEAIAGIVDESEIYTLYFFWEGENNPKVKSMLIQQYRDGLKDPSAESIKRIRESAVNIPDTAEGVIALYDEYWEEIINAHIFYKTGQISAERFISLNELSKQMISNLINGVSLMDDALYPADFQSAVLELMHEGIALIDESMDTERSAEQETTRNIMVSIQEYCARFTELALQFDYEISNYSSVLLEMYENY